MLLHDFAPDLLMGEAALVLTGNPAPSCTSPPPLKLPEQVRSDKNIKAETAQGSLAAVKEEPDPAAESSKVRRKKQAEALKKELQANANLAPQYIQEWIDAQFQKEDRRSAMGQVMREICKNCLFSKRGVQEHSLRKCRELGNKCSLPCFKCINAGRVNDIYHWAQDCPHDR